MTIPVARDVWRKYVIPGVPASGPQHPDKTEIITWATFYETLFTANAGASGAAFSSLAALNANLNFPANTTALVIGDAAGNVGQYVKVGASGVGSWTRIADLPTAVVRMTVSGGTANAIQVTAPETPTAPANKLFLVTFTATNLAGGVTLASNGGTAYPVKDIFGNDPGAGALQNGLMGLLAWSVDHYQILLATPVDASGILADCLAAATSAASSAAALGSQVHQYDTLTELQAATVPGGVNAVRTLGRASIGVGGATYTRLGSAPGTPRSWHTQSGDGAWWIMQVGWFLTPAMFGATASNTAIQDALDYLNTFGLTGGRVTLEPNLIYSGTQAPVIWNGLTLDGNGSKIESTLSGASANAYGVRVGDNAEFCNGWAHSIDGGITGGSGIYGAGISLGETYGAGGTIGSLTYFANFTRPRLRNVKTSSTRAGGQAVYIFGDVQFDIDGLEIPDSTATGGALSADWGTIGDTTVALGSGSGGAYISDLERLTKWRAAFDAGTMISVHPRGAIRRVRIGSLTSAATHNGAIRLSACHDVTIFDVYVKEINGPVINHLGGDYGFEFATPSVKLQAYRNTRIHGVRADKCSNWGAYINTWGDNVAPAAAATAATFTGSIDASGVLTASSVTGTISLGATLSGGTVVADTVIKSQLTGTTGAAGTYQTSKNTVVASASLSAPGYTPLLPAVTTGDVVVDGLSVVGASGSTSDGIRVEHSKGVQVLNAKVTGFGNAIGIEDEAEDLRISGCLLTGNAFNGVLVKGVSTIKNVAIERNDIQACGTSGSGFAGVKVNGGLNIRIAGNVLGSTTETTMQYGVYVDSAATARATTIVDNAVRSVKSGGTCFNVGASGTDVLWMMRGNSYSGSETFNNGQTVIPVERTPRVSGSAGSAGQHTRYICGAGFMTGGITPPSGPTYVQGDLCEVPDAASSTCAIARRGASTWASLVNVP